MNKKSKVIAGLSVSVLSLGIMCYGFSQWSSDIQLNGTVSANGSWDVVVTDASLKVSEGTEFSYNSFNDNKIYINSYAVKNDMESKIAELKKDGATIIASDASKTMRKASVSYYDAQGEFHNGELVGYFATSEEAKEANNEFASNVIKSGGSVNSKANSTVWYYTIQYTSESSTAEFTESSVNYSNVNFTLPGSWAEYSVTISNQGTAKVNLSDYKFEVSELDDFFVVDTPDLSNDILEAGESCTVTFVVKTSDSADKFEAESQPFSINLTYEQDAVEDAPSAKHIH